MKPVFRILDLCVYTYLEDKKKNKKTKIKIKDQCAFFHHEQASSNT